MNDQAEKSVNEEDMIESATVGDIKGITILPALTSILNPSAEYLGQEIKGGIQSVLEGWKDKWRAKNIQEHIRVVRQNIREKHPEHSFNPEDINPDQFVKWAEGAQDVPADNSCLSLLWQGLFKDISDGKAVEVTLMETLKRMTPLEVEHLLHWNGRFLPPPIGVAHSKTLHVLEGLQKVGVVTDHRLKHLMKKVFMYSIALLAACILSSRLAVLSENISIYETLFASAFIQVITSNISVDVLTLVVFNSGWVYLVLSPYELTWIGQELRRSALKAQKQSDSNIGS